MKQLLLSTLFIVASLMATAQEINYTSLDKTNPIDFKGEYITYQNNKIELGPNAFFIDGQLSDSVAALYPFVFNSINEASKQLQAGTEQHPMTLYIAPYVYWIDNPDDPQIRVGIDGSTPYGLKINCPWLRFYGLSDNPQNVVLACNRGQTIGAKGNFTMLKILGDGISSENITFGNYCNVDLEFSLKPELNRKKRASAIVQAQLIHCNGDKIVARNTHFISRLNLCNFVGAKRILFDRCHMECTDDALCGSGVYLNCTFDFHSSKPFYHTTGTGAVFLNCDINSLSGSTQHFTKANGQLAVVDTRFESKKDKYISWNDITPIETRNYQDNVTLNGKSILIGEKDKASTINISEKSLISAFKITTADTTLYNSYNLLKGDDNWDPMGIKPLVMTLERQTGETYTNIPVQMKVAPTRKIIETGKDTMVLKAKLYRFGNYKTSAKNIKWHLADEFSDLARLHPSDNGQTCQVIPTNKHNDTRQIIVVASTDIGLEAASVLNISPERLNAPEFIELPNISKPLNGQLVVDYKLDMAFDDESLISWYRCGTQEGDKPIKVAVSRLNQPFKTYSLSTGDIGYYMMVKVAPKHLRCDAGKAKSYIYKKAIKAKDIITPTDQLETDFKNVSVENQLRIKPGFWTFRPLATSRNGKVIPADTTKNAWFYGKGRQGNANMFGLLQTGRSGTMLYTPVMPNNGNMRLELVVSPYKTAGQGFSVAPLFMDVLIKLDTKNMTGYGLRFQRTTKYGNAVDCYFVKYELGHVKPISKSITTSCFRSPCSIELAVSGNKISAKASTKGNYANPQHPEILPAINISTEIEENSFGGFGIQYNGGSTTMINWIQAVWK